MASAAITVNSRCYLDPHLVCIWKMTHFACYLWNCKKTIRWHGYSFWFLEIFWLAVTALDERDRKIPYSSRHLLAQVHKMDCVLVGIDLPVRPIFPGIWILGGATSVLQVEDKSTLAEAYSDKRQLGLNCILKETCCSQNKAQQCVAIFILGFITNKNTWLKIKSLVLQLNYFPNLPIYINCTLPSLNTKSFPVHCFSNSPRLP